MEALRTMCDQERMQTVGSPCHDSVTKLGLALAVRPCGRQVAFETWWDFRSVGQGTEGCVAGSPQERTAHSHECELVSGWVLLLRDPFHQPSPRA